MDNGREYREYDLPTDTDDSSVGQSSPLDGKSFYSGSGKKNWHLLQLFLCMFRTQITKL